MRGPAHRIGTRLQLIALFGLLLLTGMTVLVIDEASEYLTRRALDELKSESLAGLRRMKALSDAYSLDIVDTAFKVRNDLMGWEQGAGVVENAVVRIRQHWSELQTMARPPEQQALYVQIVQARTEADRAVDRLRRVLQSEDIVALGRFADTEMFPAIDPVTTRLKFLSDLEMIDAERVVRADAERVQRVRLWRIALSLLTLVIAALVGRGIVRNIYRGVENLTLLAQRMQQRDFEVEPRYRPRGELGEVMDAFLAMRADMLSHETELTELLAHTEDVRRTLEQRDLFQRSLLSAAQVAIVALDAQGRFTHVNPFAERLLGWRSEELVGRSSRRADGQSGGGQLPHFLQPAQLRQVAQELGATLEREIPADWRVLQALAEQGYPPQEWTLTRKDGSAVPVLTASSAMKDDAGALVGLLTVSTDLTEIKQLERELRASEQRAREANRAKSAFLAAMSHEIRTPLIGVTGMVEVLEHTRLDDDQRRALGIIQHSAQALLQIIGDILDFSKIEAGKLDLAPLPVSLRKLVAGAVHNFLGSASSKGLNLGFEVEEDVARAHLADPLRIRQILGNFIGNAIKFTEQGEVKVRVRRLESSAADERIEFSVEDTGIGISEEAQQRLFQPFSQAESDTTRRFGGSGLGLSICRRLAALMGGEIHLRSAPGQGTTLFFVARFPLARIEDVEGGETLEAIAEPRFVPRPLPSPEQAERERSLVLLVDDHPTNRLVIARQLGLAGFVCETAEDGEHGLDRWRSGRYALVLSDIHMPRMDGLRMTAAIRAIERREGLARTPILALTAAALKGDAERCLGAGMDDYLVKPVSIPTLVDRLHAWLPHLKRPGPPGAGREDTAGLPIEPVPFDADVLRAASGGDARLERELLVDYLSATRSDVSALHAALHAGDLESVGREAHRLKGAARLVGAVALAETAARLETAAQDRDLAAASTLLPALDAALAQVLHFGRERHDIE